MEKRGVIILSLLVSFICLSFISATVTVVSPASYSNYTTSMIANCTTDVIGALNATFLYNANGGIATSLLGNVITNTSTGQTIFSNASVDLSALTQTSTYNISCVVCNSTECQATDTNNIMIDYSAPYSIVQNYPTSNLNSSSASINFNFTAIDAIALRNCSLYIDGVLNQTVAVTNASAKNISLTLNQGAHNWSTTCKDWAGNSNSSSTLNFTVDTSALNWTVDLNSQTETSLGVGITIDDGAGTGVNGTCAISRTGASISGSGSIQNISESSLSCGTEYIYNITCWDFAGNPTSSLTYQTTDSCSSSRSSNNRVVPVVSNLTTNNTVVVAPPVQTAPQVQKPAVNSNPPAENKVVDEQPSIWQRVLNWFKNLFR